MAEVVLDASAILAVIFGEAGSDVVRAHMDGAVVSTVNLAEVVAKLADRGATVADAEALFSELTVAPVAFDAEQAWSSGALRVSTRQRGLSLGDRACLALARSRGVPALTGDRAWADVAGDVEVVMIR